MDQAVSFAASTFRKVLKGFEIGGLQYTDVQFHLQRLLAAGAPADELQDVLRRCERITPLPEYAHAEVLRLLEEARQHEILIAQQIPAPEPIEDLDSPADVPADLSALRAALEQEQLKTQELGAALAERIASEQAARARGEEARRDSEQSQAQLRSSLQSLISRDAIIAQMRGALEENNARFAALQTQHAQAASAFESQSKNGTQLTADLRGAFDAEQRKRQELEKTLARNLALHEAALASQSNSGTQLTAELTELRATIASQQRKRQELEKLLAQQAALLQSESAAQADKLKSGEAELQGVRRRADALAKDLKAAQRDLEAQGSERDKLRSQINGLNTKLKDNDGLIDRLQQSVRAGAQLVAELKTVAKRRALAEPLVANPPPLDNVVSLVPSRSAVVEVGEFAPQISHARWQPRIDVRWLGIGAAVVLLAIISWAFAHRAPVPVKAPAAVAAVLPQKAGTTLRDCPTCPSLTVLPAGRFEQGTAVTDKSASAFEKPLHWVAILHPFAMSTDSVTVDQFREFAAKSARDMQGCDTYDGDWRHRADGNWDNPGFAQSGSSPVTCVSWNDAKAYAAWLSAKTGHRYRLPSASEWEYAARSGAAAVQPWPDAATACAGANVADQSAARRFPGWTVFGCDDGYVFTAPVGSFKANAFGLNDMLGNVFQWTEDCWHADYGGAPVDGSARTDGDCTEHELRGGSWFSTPAYVRANYRNHFAADYRTSSVGIRVVRDLT